MRIKNKETFKEMIRFMICGGIATVVDFIIFGVIIYFISPEIYGMNLFKSIFADRSIVPSKSVLWGTAAGFMGGLIVNYIISVTFVYRYTERAKSLHGIIYFIVLSITGLFLNILLMKTAYDYIGLNHWIAKVIVTGIVFIYNYLTKRILIFKP